MTSQDDQQRLADVLALKEFFGNMTNDQIIEALDSLDKFLFYFKNPALEEHPFIGVRDNVFDALFSMAKGNLAFSLELAKKIVEVAEDHHDGRSYLLLAGRMVAPWVGVNSFASIFFVETVLPRLKLWASEREIGKFKEHTADIVRTQSVRDYLAKMGLDEKLAEFYGVAPMPKGA